MIGALNEFATYGIEPDITFVLGQGSAAANATRLNAREALDRIELETAEFHKSVTAYFEALPAAVPERVHFVNTSHARSDAAREVLEILQARFVQINLEALDIDAELAAFDARHAN
jgi:thymidylate kinase